jgi:hypothetical protein
MMNTPPDYPRTIDPEEVRARQRASRIDFLARLLMAEGAFDIGISEELGDLLDVPEPAVFPEDAA